jgi:hypothetical protein
MRPPLSARIVFFDAETRRKTRRGKNRRIKSKPEAAEEAENREKPRAEESWRR